MLYKYFVLTVIFSVFAFSSCTDRGERNAGKTDVQDTTKGKNVIQDQVEVDEYPTVLKTVTPKYPEEARKKGIEGEVVVQALVGKKGEVQELKVIKNESGSAEFGKAAMDAVKQWKFKPATKKGDTVSIWIAIPVKFKLDDKKSK